MTKQEKATQLHVAFVTNETNSTRRKGAKTNVKDTKLKKKMEKKEKKITLHKPADLHTAEVYTI